MKTKAIESNNRRASESGVALVLVLGMLVLLSGLLLAFLTTATTERTATQSSSDGASARQIADSTINLVIGQIRDATSATKPNGDINEAMTWASQPGAIRTYSGEIGTTNTSKYPAGGGTYPSYQTGKDDYVFKLYSSDRLKVTSDAYSNNDLPEEVGVINDWDRLDPNPEYVDLNEPILSPRPDADESGFTVEPRYPIIDPRAMYTRDDRNNPDPRSSAVEGFDARLTFDATLKMTDGKGNKSSEPVPYLPMPVKWLYVLRDGSMGPASRATATNPIVGRSAFWSDDESCKLNINTASEGTFWDTPTASSIQESGKLNGNSGSIDYSGHKLSFGASQPVKGEYQRYPGHPMTTCLSPVFGWLYGLTSATPVYPDYTPYTRFKEAIYDISPFIPNGRPTTQGATWNSDPDAPTNQQNGFYLKDPQGNWTPNAVVSTKHLYATVDELLFQPERNTFGGNPKGLLNGALTPQALEKVRFFLTATSRSPELNLFGRPRVTVWPVAAEYDLRTNFDDLFAFASTIYKTPTNDVSKDKRYHLTRSNAKSDREDLPDSETGKNAQNRKMMNYLKEMTSATRPIPGFGGSFKTKYGLDRDQILTEMFDYMRTVNMTDTGTASRTGNIFVPYTPRFYPDGIVHDYTRRARSNDWAGQVTPLKDPDGTPNGNMGLGRFLTISEAALVFTRVNVVPATTPPSQGIQATLLLEMASPMAGYPGLRDTYWTKIYLQRDSKNTNIPYRKLEILFPGRNPVDAEFCTANDPYGLINIVNISNHEVAQGRAYMPVLGYANAFHYFPEHTAVNPNYVGDPTKDPTRSQSYAVSRKTFTWPIPLVNYSDGYRRSLGTAGTVTNYPYISKIVPIPAAEAGKPVPTTFSFKGPSLVVEIYTGEAPATGFPPGDPKAGDPRSTLVQTIKLDFPDMTAAVALPTGNLQPFNLRFDTSNGDNGGKNNFINDGGASDVVRSVELSAWGNGNPDVVEPQEGDIRLAAARTNVPATYYTPRGGLAKYNSTLKLVHGLSRGHGDPEPSDVGGSATYSGGNGSSLAANGSSRDSKRPILPIGINGVKRADKGPGDWDRGLSKHMDGAMGNKVDEGNLKFDYNDGSDAGKIPYFRGRGIEETGQSFFSPNRQFPSAVMFGSLPTGVRANNDTAGLPWQTLLFRPDREIGPGHPGAKPPPDHLWLDLFHMPVVEPFAISEPFSTMGKVNMNYVIAPFGYAPGEKKGGPNLPNTVLPRSYIHRDTALRGVLKSVMMMAVPTNQAEGAHTENPHSVSTQFRYPILLDKTLEELEVRLNDQRRSVGSRDTTLFRSASEICEIDLFPNGLGVSSFATFWDTQYAQTGDNMRERPYAHIFPRLTTKSNVFTVYMRCQTIRKAPNTDPGSFDPARDTVVAEYRGSATIERFIDPNDPKLENYDENKERVDPYYRFRIVGTKHFAPR